VASAIEAAAQQKVVTRTTLFPDGQDSHVCPAASDLIVSALSGFAAVNRLPEQAPLKVSGYQTGFVGGAAAAAGTLASLYARLKRGKGGVVDSSTLVGVLGPMATALLAWQYAGRPFRAQNSGFPGPVSTKDGRLVVTVSRLHFWREALDELGLSELAHDDARYMKFRKARADGQPDREVSDAVESRIGEWNRDDLFEALSARHVTAGKVMTMKDLWSDAHLRSRRDSDVDEPDTVIPPFRMTATRVETGRTAPSYDEHRSAILAELKRRGNAATVTS
jgi:crotonobetainyl-CoA:carnitine CoA-transferase CaiB-like acyl-CoA transferase